MKTILILCILSLLALQVFSAAVPVSFTVADRPATILQNTSSSFAVLGENSTFICDYRFNGTPIIGADCNVSINSILYNATWNGTIYNYTSNLSVGVYSWRCECSKLDYQQLNGSLNNYTVYLNAPPIVVTSTIPTQANSGPAENTITPTIETNAPINQPQLIFLMFGMLGVLSLVFVWKQEN